VASYLVVPNLCLPVFNVALLQRDHYLCSIGVLEERRDGRPEGRKGTKKSGIGGGKEG